ncbi:polycystin-2-like [Condylostylus longicornis]|uniref:polycystin-2-like n=1 Tax=Condylostylus longicornis TaxID=2530218 RepID=UPI00244E0102|nr:polycystin-2-like [Condylostylus longicornis]
MFNDLELLHRAFLTMQFAFALLTLAAENNDCQNFNVATCSKKRIFIIDIISSMICALIKVFRKKEIPIRKISQNLMESKEDELIYWKNRIKYLTEYYEAHYFKNNNNYDEELNIYYKDILNDLIMFTFYITSLLLIILWRRDQRTYYSTKVVESFITKPKWNKVNIKLNQILWQDDFYYWINETFIKHFNDGRYHNGERIKDTGWITEGTAKILGVVRLNQHRIVPNSCNKNFFDIRNCEFEKLLNPWKFDCSGMEFPIYGDLVRYSSCGYIAELGRNLKNSYHILKFLKNNNWIDHRTAVIFIEFNLYDVNSNIFIIVTIIAEKTPYGNYIISQEINSLKLLLILENLDTITVRFFKAAYFQIYLTGFSAFLVCLATIRIWKVLQFAILFRIFTKTLFNAFSSLLSASIIILIFLISFCLCCTMINGQYTKNFSSIDFSLSSLIAICAGFAELANLKDLSHGGHLIGVLLYIVLTIVVLIYLINMFIIVLCFYFSVEREHNNDNYSKKYKTLKRLSKSQSEYIKLYIQFKQNKFVNK